MPPPRSLRVILVADESPLRDSIVRALEDDGSIVQAASRSRPALEQELPVGDVVLSAMAPPEPSGAGLDGSDATSDEPVALVIGSDMSEEIRWLTKSVGAVVYLKEQSAAAEIAPLVVALAALSSTQGPD